MTILSFFIALFRSIGVWPPTTDVDPTPWRRSTFMILWGLVGVLTFHIAGVKGHLEFMGIERMAHVSDVQTIDDRTKSILYAIYAPQVRALIRERCDTPGAKERERINNMLDRLLRDYRDAAGVDFKPIPRCEEV